MSVAETAEKIREALQALPDGFSITVTEDGEAIILGNDELAFCVTALDVKDGLALDRATKAFPTLKKAIAQHHAMIAAKLDADTLVQIAKQFMPPPNFELSRRGKH